MARPAVAAPFFIECMRSHPANPLYDVTVLLQVELQALEEALFAPTLLSIALKPKGFRDLLTTVLRMAARFSYSVAAAAMAATNRR